MGLETVNVRYAEYDGYWLINTFEVLIAAQNLAEAVDESFHWALQAILEQQGAVFTRTGCVVILTGGKDLDEVAEAITEEFAATRKARNATKH